jgi:hypothetical protein
MANAKRYSRGEIVEISNEIKAELFKQYEKRGGFSDADNNSGLILNCAGLTSILLLKNGLENDIKYSETEVLTIKKVYKEILDYINVYGYDATPFLTSERTKNYFLPGKEYSYTDSVSWVLSVFVQLWNADKLESGVLIDEDYRENVKILIKNTLVLINESSTELGGWGFTRGCPGPDIYYSYTISESLADFADYILGESLEEGIGNKDQELIDYLSNELVDAINERRRQTAKWLVDSFILNSKNKLGEILINPFDVSGETFLGLEEAEKFKLLYYTFFVIDMLIINNADLIFKESAQLISQSIEHGIYLSRIYFDKARKTRNHADGWWNDKVLSELNIDFASHPSINTKNLSNNKIKEPGLVPLALRCNVLYSFYISDGPDNKIDEFYKILLEEKNSQEDDHRLWDLISYNLLITERAIEGLIDYIDYNDFLKKYSASNEISELPDESLSTKLPYDIDSLLKQYIENSIKEHFSRKQESTSVKESISDDELQIHIEKGIKKYLSEHPYKTANDISFSDEGNKNDLLNVLIEVFDDWSNLIRGDNDTIKTLSTKYNTSLTNFSARYAESLKCLLFYKLKEKTSPDKIDDLFKNLDNQDLLFNQLAVRLNKKEDPVNFGLLFSQIIETVNKK